MRFKYSLILFFLIFSIFSYSKCVNLNVKGPKWKNLEDKVYRDSISSYFCFDNISFCLSPDKKYFLVQKDGHFYILDKNLDEIKFILYCDVSNLLSNYKKKLLKDEEYSNFAKNNFIKIKDVFGKIRNCPEVFWIKRGLLFCEIDSILLYDFCKGKKYFKLENPQKIEYDKNNLIKKRDETFLKNFVVTDDYVFFSMPHQCYNPQEVFLNSRHDMVSNKLCKLSLSDGKVTELIKYEGKEERFFYLKFVKDGKVYFFDFTKDWDCYFYTLDIESGKIKRIEFAHNILAANYSRRGMPYVYYRYGTISLVYYDRLYVFDGKTMKLKKMLKRPFKFFGKENFYGPAFFINDDVILYSTCQGGFFHKRKNDELPYQYCYYASWYLNSIRLSKLNLYSVKEDKVIYQYNCGWLPEEIIMIGKDPIYTFFIALDWYGGLRKVKINLDEIGRGEQ